MPRVDQGDVVKSANHDVGFPYDDSCSCQVESVTLTIIRDIFELRYIDQSVCHATDIL